MWSEKSTLYLDQLGPEEMETFNNYKSLLLYYA
jgi:hypothetical protein